MRASSLRRVLLALLCFTKHAFTNAALGLAASDTPDLSTPPQPSFEFPVNANAGSPRRRIIVKSSHLDEGLPGQVAAVSERLGISVLDVDVGSDADMTQMVEQIGNRSDVEFAVRDDVLWAIGQPSDPEYRFQWGLPRVRAPQAWDIVANATKGRGAGSPVTVCVTDSGVDPNHPDLIDSLHPLIGYNAVDKSTNVMDGLSHGTHIAGIIGATFNNSKFIAGVAWNKVDVLSCKFLTDEGYGYTSDAISCIDYCISMGANIITNSWSGGEANPALYNAIAEAGKQDILFVVAAGNVGNNVDFNTTYPASYAKDLPNMLVVGSTGYTDGLSSFSNYGPETVHIAAPGEWILSTIPNASTAYFSGTSMAAPLVAGAAGIILSLSNNTMGALEIKQVLLDTVEELPSLKGKVMSEGILRVDKAVRSVLEQMRSDSPARGPSFAPASGPAARSKLSRRSLLSI